MIHLTEFGGRLSWACKSKTASGEQEEEAVELHDDWDWT